MKSYRMIYVATTNAIAKNPSRERYPSGRDVDLTACALDAATRTSQPLSARAAARWRRPQDRAETFLKGTRVIVAEIACAPNIGWAQSAGSRPQNFGPPPAQERSAPTPAAQRRTIVIGGSAGFGISYLPLTITEDKSCWKSTRRRSGSTTSPCGSSVFLPPRPCTRP